MRGFGAPQVTIIETRSSLSDTKSRSTAMDCEYVFCGKSNLRLLYYARGMKTWTTRPQARENKNRSRTLSSNTSVSAPQSAKSLSVAMKSNRKCC